MKIIKTIQLKNVISTAVKNRCILHGRVFVMSIEINVIPKGLFVTTVICTNNIIK